MSPVLVAVFLCLVSQSSSVEPEEIQGTCQKKFNLENADIVEMRQNHMVLKDENNSIHRCFIDCLMTEAQMVVNGELNQEEVKRGAHELNDFYKARGKQLDIDKFDNSVAVCAAKNGDGECMKSYQMWKCLVSNMDTL